MLIVKPSVQLLWTTPNALQEIERAGRVCYKSEDRITRRSANRFVTGLIERGHLAVIEHASASFLFVCDRGVSHETVRHRIASYCQESTRFCNYGKDKFAAQIRVVKPSWKTKDQERVWKTACETAEAAYMRLLSLGATPQEARSVLPTCLKTEVVMTANFREWLHFRELRTSPKAHPQMRELALRVDRILARKFPCVFARSDTKG